MYKHVATHSVEAYARSRELSVLEAFTEAWCGFTHNEKPTMHEAKRILDEKVYWDSKRVLPHYVVRWLEITRTRQMQQEQTTLYAEPMFI